MARDVVARIRGRESYSFQSAAAPWRLAMRREQPRSRRTRARRAFPPRPRDPQRAPRCGRRPARCACGGRCTSTVLPYEQPGKRLAALELLVLHVQARRWPRPAARWARPSEVRGRWRCAGAPRRREARRSRRWACRSPRADLAARTRRSWRPGPRPAPPRRWRPRRPRRMFSITVPLNSTTSWNTSV